MKKPTWVLIGKCAVDSGQIMLVDPCYVLPEDKKNSTDEAYTYKQLLKERNDKLSQKFIFSGIGGSGVIVSSGFGDGMYPVYAKIKEIKYKNGFKEKRIAEVRIKFI